MKQPSPSGDSSDGHFKRSLGLLPAIAVNMTCMCGIGPLITIPLMISTMGGPQAVLAWVAGAVLVLADGFVWAELGAAMPGAGGSYLYLREAFQYSSGRLVPFLFVWTAMLFIPLTMSTGVIGVVQYANYLFPRLPAVWISMPSVVLVIFLLYRNILAVGKITVVLWIVMFVTMGAVIVASLTHFNAKLAFTYPPGSFRMGGPFFSGLGSGLILAIYDYGGYSTTAFIGSEMRDPGRVIPRSIFWSIGGMMVIYLVMNIGVLGVLPWQKVAASPSIGSDLIAQVWGLAAAKGFTVLVIITALASVLTGLLAGSRLPYNAARDKVFFHIFGKLHPRLDFPHVALLAMGIITAIGCFFDLTTLINLLTAVAVLLQSIAQVAALTILRRRQPNLPRPYRMMAYPLPSIIAMIGWVYVYISSGLKIIEWSLAWLLAGVVAFLIWAADQKQWPFGPKEIREEFISR